MPYGQIKVDEITFTNAGVDQTISVSGVVASISGNITATGTISGNVIRGGTLVSGATVTGTAGQFGTITGNTAGFTTVTGTTVTGTTAQFTTVTGGTAGFTTITGGTATITSGVFASGTAAAPSVSVGTTDNGIYSPGADQVAVATNGTGRLFIDSSGRVLVGTSSALNVEPFVAAQVQTEARYGYASIYRANDAGGPALYFIKSRAASAATVVQSGDVLGEIRFQGADGGDYETPGGTIKCEVDGTPGANDMPGRIVLATTADGASSPTERLRITSAGLVGIGTSSPSANLHVAAAVSDPILFSNTSGSAYNTAVWQNNNNFKMAVGIGGGSVGGGLSDVAYIGPVSNIPLNIQTNNTARISITAGGNVGIGTTSPSAILDVKVASDAKLLVQDGNTTGNVKFNAVNNAVSANVNLEISASNTQFFNGGSERARIDSSGRLLVGTSSTSEGSRAVFQGWSGDASGSAILKFALGVATPAADQYLAYFDFTDSGHLPGARFGAQRDGGTWSGSSKPSRLVFSTTADGASSPTERMRITSVGDVRSMRGFLCDKGSIGTNGGTISYDAGADRFVAVNNSGGGFTGVSLAPSATSWGVYSDERLKTNLLPIENGLAKIGALRAVTGRYLSDPEDTSRSFLIAQDVQAVLPEAVSATADQDAYLDLRYPEVIPLLVAALKESKKHIETLQGMVAVNNITIDEQQHQISALAARLTALEAL